MQPIGPDAASRRLDAASHDQIISPIPAAASFLGSSAVHAPETKQVQHLLSLHRLPRHIQAAAALVHASVTIQVAQACATPIHPGIS
jgi:hypothetical protein